MQRVTQVQGSVLRQALAEVFENTPPVLAMQVVDAASARMRVLSGPSERMDVTIPDGAWRVLWPVLQIATRSAGLVKGGYLVLRGDQVLVAQSAELAQVFAPVVAPAADRTDTDAAPELRAEDSAAIHPLGRTFDPVLLYGGAVPPGVRFVGVERQDGVLAIVDGPGSPGSPVVGERTQGFVRELLRLATGIPGAHGVVVAVASQQVYAVSGAAFDSIVTRQAMPIKRESTAWDKANEIAAYVPTRVFVLGAEGRRYASDPRPIARAISFTGFLLCMAAAMIGIAMLKMLSNEPIYAWVSTTPGVDILDTPAFGFVIFGVLITMARVLSYAPALFQVLGMLFSRSKLLGVYMFWTATAMDTAINTQFWYKLVSSAVGLDAIGAKYGDGIGAAANVGVMVISVLAAAATSVGSEGIIVLSLVLAVALWPGFVAAIGGALKQVFILTPIRVRYGARALARETRHTIEEHDAQYQLIVAEPLYIEIDPVTQRVHEVR